ncbi:MAG TPA: TIGR04290 family methyltransferase [Mycobacteriales bacterium]|nr:TIGR04290 family methyltransferase [Mycobacteriales bacterium]
MTRQRDLISTRPQRRREAGRTLQSAGTAGGHADVARLGPWFHNLHLPGGVQTAPDHPLGDFPRFKWQQVQTAVPTDLSGCRALDIGCNAGFYSFELAQRGAHVLAVDHDEHYLEQARWAREQLGLSHRVELRQLGVYDLARLDEQFDLVLFMGVLYHLRYPLLALDLVAERVSGRLVFQTLTLPGEEHVDPPEDLSLDERHRLLDPGWPAMAFVENRMAGDPTNWWLANASGVEAMLRSAGLRVTARPGHEIWVCERERPNPHRTELAAANGRAG